MRNQLLKKTVLAFAALFAFAVTSVAQNAQLLSFGFYQADNTGLSQDYVATIPDLTAGATTYDVEIGLPASVDLTALVARFTVNDGNTVTVEGAAQTSGVTKNDFTDPVDYLVRGSNNVRYTITVVEAASSGKGWKELAVLDATQLSGNEAFTGVFSGAVLAISPKDNAPYVAYGSRGVDNKMSVAKFENGAWTQVGQANFSGVINGSHYDFDIAPDGTPYVAYGDKDATTQASALSVMKFDGTAWSFVGEQGFFKAQSQYVGLAALKGGLVAALQNNNKSGDVPQRAMGLATYDGAAWTYGESSLLASGEVKYALKVGGNGKVATVISINRGVVDGVNYGHNIFKYENGQWESLATNFLETGATQTSIAIGSFGTTVALDGTIYAWTGDDAPNTDKVYQVRLKKYNAETKTWSTVAGNTLPIGHDGGFESHISLDVAIAPDGTPYVAYNNFKDQKKLYVMYLDPSTNQWSAAQQLAEDAEDVNIKFDKVGTCYITYTDANNKIHLLKYGAVGAGGVIDDDVNEDDEKPAISFEATPGLERSITVGLNAAGTVKVDWGDGTPVEMKAAAAYDGWDNALEFTGTPSGTVKVYGEGISYFQGFTKFVDGELPGGITSIDLSNATDLTELDIHQNKLAAVDLSKLTALNTLTIGVNDFETIDLSANTELTSIDFSNGKLTAIDLSKNTKLTKVVLSGNKLTTLDFTNNPLVKTFTVLNNQLTDVNIGANTAKGHTFQFGGNKLTSFSLAEATDLATSFVYLRDNDLTSLTLPAAVRRIWVDGNAFNLAQLYELKSLASQTFTYATTFTKEQAQQPYAIDATSTTGTIDLSALAKLGETATVFTWKKADGTALVEGTDYTVTDGVFSFLKPVDGIHCEMTNAELDAFTAEKPYTTTVTNIAVADGIFDVINGDGDGVWRNLKGQQVTTPRKGVFVKDGKAVIFK